MVKTALDIQINRFVWWASGLELTAAIADTLAFWLGRYAPLKVAIPG